MLQGLLILMGSNLAGEVIVSLSGLLIPAPIVGMVLLFLFLLFKGSVPENLNDAGGALLKHIGLIFVPAGAGISMYIGLIAEEWFVILVASLSATILTLLSCGWLFQWMWKGGHNDSE